VCGLCSPTHWEQSVIYVSRPVAVRQADIINGIITILPSPSYQRLITHWSCWLITVLQMLVNVSVVYRSFVALR